MVDKARNKQMSTMCRPMLQNLKIRGNSRRKTSSTACSTKNVLKLSRKNANVIGEENT